MNILFAISCLLALASVTSSYGGGVGHGFYHDQQIPIIGPKGVPLETPEVAAARKKHLAAHEAAKAQLVEIDIISGGKQGTSDIFIYPIKEGITAGYKTHVHHIHNKYHGPIHIPKIGKNGVPYDTPEVAVARAEHLKALHKASSQGGHQEEQHRYRRNAVSHVSIHTPASLEKTHVNHGNHYGSPWAHHYPAIGHDGKPLETPEVVELKHAHFAAHHKALSKLHHEGIQGGIVEHREHILPTGNELEHNYHIPVIGSHGVPLDTPEVAKAKEAHLAIHAQASSKIYNQY